MSRPAVFLDRDGVLVEDKGYVHCLSDLRILPGVPEALHDLRKRGFLLVVVTNQAGIARGLYSEEQFYRFTKELDQRLGFCHASPDATYFCPHHPTEGIGTLRVECRCRKPAPGMLLRAAKEFDIDVAGSYMIGDKASDIEAGRRAGVGATIYIAGTDGDSNLTAADFIATSMTDAATWIASKCQVRRP